MTNAVPWSAPKAAFRALWKFFIPEWRFGSAQWYEFKSAKGTIRRRGEHMLDKLDSMKAAGDLWQTADDPFFGGDQATFSTFIAHVRDRVCLEIGSGPYGYLGPAYWIKNRKVIEPLIDKYRSYELTNYGRTFWTPDVETFATPAENIIPKLRGAIDGAIICRNALDHMEDPLGVLNAISEYAAPGCYLLFWTDIWHNGGTDIGHRNITRSIDVMPKIITGLGFEIQKTCTDVRSDDAAIEYGCVALKK